MLSSFFGIAAGSSPDPTPHELKHSKSALFSGLELHGSQPKEFPALTPPDKRKLGTEPLTGSGSASKRAGVTKGGVLVPPLDIGVVLSRGGDDGPTRPENQLPNTNRRIIGAGAGVGSLGDPVLASEATAAIRRARVEVGDIALLPSNRASTPNLTVIRPKHGQYPPC